jgi:hypothetical protein
MQTIQPSRRHSYSDEENRAILDAYRNSFFIDHEQNLNLILALSRNNFKELNKHLNIRNLRSHIDELKKNKDYCEFFLDAETNAKNTRDLFINKERIDSSIENENIKRRRVLSQHSQSVISQANIRNIINEMDGKYNTFQTISHYISYMNQLLHQRPVRIESPEPLSAFCRNLRLVIQNIPRNRYSLVNVLRHYLANVYNLCYTLNEIHESLKFEILRNRHLILEKFNVNETILQSRISRYFHGESIEDIDMLLIGAYEHFYKFKIVIYEVVNETENFLTFNGEHNILYRNILVMGKSMNYYSLLYTDRIETRYRISSQGAVVTSNSEITIQPIETVNHEVIQQSISRLNSYVSLDEELITNNFSRMSIDDSPA